jgi:hypothetical protein
LPFLMTCPFGHKYIRPSKELKMNQLRLLFILFLIIIGVGGYHSLFYYAAVMMGSIEFLNHRKAYLNLPNFKLFNAIFMGYLALIIVNRSRHIKFGLYTEGSLNIAEHGFFALVICLKLWVYFHLFSNYSPRLKAVLVALAFNLIGVINEIFQNQLNHRALFEFIEDARKDMTVNVLGTFLFLGILGLNHFLFKKMANRRHSG